ncbi:hypothetical protein [Georgenia sp. Z1491]|uniref:hypothetical protein n=1 Tax=Georgenia sp. Z1491 TaxID=3416707 RepID=UPI003CF07494
MSGGADREDVGQSTQRSPATEPSTSHGTADAPEHATPSEPVARITYLYLRLILMTLPALLLLGSVLAFFWLGAIEESVSAYYLGPIRDMFVGVMMGIAACLVAYRGASALEDFSLDVAGFFAIFVALVPTSIGPTLDALDAAARHEMITALRATCVTVLVMSVVFVVVEVRFAPSRPAPLNRHRLTRVVANVMNAVLVMFVGLVVWRLVEGEDFAGVHVSAAVLLIVNLAIAVASHAWPELTGGPHASLDAGRRDLRRRYRLIFWLMVAGAPLFGVLHLLGWEYRLLAVEWYEIALFVWFWALETRRTWARGLARRQRGAAR